MSVELAKSEISRFLKSDEVEVLCLRGKWGTGKTYTWTDTLKKEKDNTAFKTYSYVSLFGINSIDAFKRAILENVEIGSVIGDEISVESLKNDPLGSAKKAITRGVGQIYDLVKDAPKIKEYAQMFESAAFHAVQGWIICVDDVERKPQTPSLGEIFGLLSFLKEQRKCKVVLILNEDALQKPDREEYGRYFEKVVDISLSFKPTAEECAQIAFSNNDGSLPAVMRESCVALDISNIRVIRQIQRLVRQLQPELKNYGDEIIRSAIRTLVLLGWSKWGSDPKNEHSEIPTIDFIRRYRGGLYDRLDRDEKKQQSEQDKNWSLYLERYQYGQMDELDLALLAGIENGYFDFADVKAQAQKLHDVAEATAASGSLQSAWSIFHNTFDNNADALAAALKAAFSGSSKFISPTNLDSSVKLLKDLKMKTLAKVLINLYVEARRDEPGVFNLSEDPFASDVTDPDVLAAFKTEQAKFVDNRDPKELLKTIAEKRSWNPSDTRFLASLKPGVFYKIFKEEKDNLSQLVSQCLLFGSIGGADADMKKIGENATKALKRIGKENLINRMRVEKKYKIPVK